MTVRIPKKLHDQVRRRAEAELRSVASLTRAALLEYTEARAS
jgi:predicted HicB family RNase H-like nuclease